MTAAEKRAGLNANQIKLIAILAMTADHLTWTLWPGYSTQWFPVLLHIFGRLTAPIMWFFIVEGYYHTRSVKKYAGRLFFLALLGHFAYNFCFGIPFLPLQNSVFNQTSVAWSLAWGLVLLYVHDHGLWRPWQRTVFTMAVCLLTFPSDWSCIAAMSIFYMGLNRGNFKKQMSLMMLWTGAYALVYFFFINKAYGVIQLFTCLTIPILSRYNGERGRWKGMGKLFYAYYPAHLIVCGLVRTALWGIGSCTGVGGI